MIDPSQLCQIEIPVTDLERSIKFYQSAFNWQQAPAEMHQYAVLTVPDNCPFGVSLVQSSTSARADGVVIYFDVDDPEKIVARCLESGGRLRLGPKKLGVYGIIYQVEDPDGNRFGLFQKP